MGPTFQTCCWREETRGVLYSFAGLKIANDPDRIASIMTRNWSKA